MRLAILSLLLLASAACTSESPAPEGNAAAPAAAPARPAAGQVDRSRAGTPGPETAFEDPDGESVQLSAFEGKPLLLNLWATWCGPCVKELPTLDALAAERAGRLQVVALSQDSGGREKVDAFLAKARLGTLEPYLDSKGREVWRRVGEEDWTGPRAAALLAEATAAR